MFIQTRNRGKIALSRVRQAIRADAHDVELYGARGEHLGVAAAWEFEELTSRIIPAAPGWFVVYAELNAEPPRVSKMPIIAWRLSADHGAVPVLYSSLCDNPQGVLSPDGRVEIQDDGCFDSVESFLQHCIKEDSRRKAIVATKNTSHTTAITPQGIAP
jgi:hypothetical protein